MTTFDAIQQFWNDGIGALFGSNILTVGAFFMLFWVFILTRMGVGMELAIPSTMVMIFILTALNPGLLPVWLYTVMAIVGGLIIFVVVSRAVAR